MLLYLYQIWMLFGIIGFTLYYFGGFNKEVKSIIYLFIAFCIHIYIMGFISLLYGYVYFSSNRKKLWKKI
jgi:uncharacterized membrane protein YesL